MRLSMDGKGRNSPISALRVSSIDPQTYPLVGGSLPLAETLGDLVARAGAPAIGPAVAGAMPWVRLGHGNSIEHALRAEPHHASCRCDGFSCHSAVALARKICSADREMRWR